MAPPLLTAGDASGWQYGWTVANLQQCLMDHLTELVSDELFKCPNAETPPTVSFCAPFIYGSFIPAAILSAEGMQDPPIVPSILIECHMGEVTLPHRPNYLISVRLLLSLWDDDPSYAGYQDSQHLTEKVFLYLLKERSLSDRYLLSGRVKWKSLDSHRAEYFVSVIELTYDLDPVPDASDNIDQWLENGDHRIPFNIPPDPLGVVNPGEAAVLTVTSGAVYAIDGDEDALATNLPTQVEGGEMLDGDC